MANGRAAAVEPTISLAGEAYLAVGEIVGRAAAARILLAAPLIARGDRGGRRRRDRDGDEMAFDRASRVAARAPAPAARRADAWPSRPSPFRRDERSAHGARRAASSASASPGCRGARRSRNGATG